MKTNNKIAKKITPILLNYGGARKFIADMTVEELQTARQSILRRAKEKAFLKAYLFITLVKENYWLNILTER